MEVGSIVEIADLKSATHLNGSSGKLVRWLERDQRWAVELLALKKTVRVKPSNLVLLHGTKPTRTVLDELPTASDQVVRLRGLRGASHLNGTRGLTVKFDESAGRWAVRLDDTHQVVNCKPENVSLVSVLNRVLDGTPTEKNTRAALQFDVGRRVECINYYKLPQKFEHGTVAMTWVREKSWPDGLYAAYKVILDDGRHLYVRNNKKYIKESTAPPIDSTTYEVGDQVICQVPQSEFSEPGIVIRRNQDWLSRGVAPYLLKMNYGKYLNFWPTSQTMKFDDDKCEGVAVNVTDRLRFKVGERVECSVGVDFDPGTIVQLWYNDESQFEKNEVVPYQISLDDGTMIYAPEDTDNVIRKSDRSPPPCWICFDSESSTDNPIVRECACRGEDSGFVHVQCLIRLAKSKVPHLRSNPDVNPYKQCLTCHRSFAPFRLCHKALTKESYRLFGKEDHMENILAQASIDAMAELLKEEGFYEGAKLLLLDSLQRFRDIKREVEGLNTFMNDILTTILIKIAKIHAETRSLVHMKICLEECIELADEFNRSGFDIKCKGLVPAKYNLARYASYTGNELNALKLLEEVIDMEKKENPASDHHLNALQMCAALHFRLFESREKCIELLAEEYDLQKVIYGSNSYEVRLSKWQLEMLQRGDEPQVVVIENGDVWLGLKFADLQDIRYC